MFLVGGEALFDLFIDPQTSLLPNRVGLNAVAGGSPFNVAVGLSRLGVKSGLLTGLSIDYLGKQLRQVLQDEGVSTSYLVELDAPTTLSMVTVNEQGSPHYSFYGEAGADRQLDRDHLPELGAEVRGVHVGSYSLVVQPTADALYKLVADASKERLITLDPNVRLNVEPDVALWRKQIATFAQHAHIIKVSEEDLNLLYPDEPLETVVRGWLRDQCQWILLTQGEKGVRVFTRSLGSWLHPGRPLKPVDTVGAGDTFQAAVIAFLTEQGLDHPASVANLEREGIEAMLAFACEAAALTCTRRGPDLPRRHELPVITANSWNQSTCLSQAI